MLIKTKYAGKMITVEVSEEDCPLYECFSPHKYQHRSYNRTEGSMTDDTYYSCSHRNYHGCPVVKIKKRYDDSLRRQR